MAERDASDPGRVLVVDDDPRIRQMLSRYFEDEGYRVTTAADGPAMRRALAANSFEVILLDLILPGGEDGIDLAREIRARSDVPIIMLTGRGDITDRVVGLEVGADDYIAKPFHLREVLARVRSVMRRHHPAPRSEAAPVGELFEFDGWRLDLGRRELLSPAGAEVPLTTGEFDLLVALVRHPGRVMTREALMDLTRGRGRDAFDRTIDAQVARLRKKVESSTGAPHLIKSVRGVGYVFTARVGAISEP